MANYMTTDTELTAIADAIRNKGGTTATLNYPTGYVNAINDIETGGNAYAVISVTYPSGSTCTCIKDSIVLTAEGTSGLYNFLIPEAGDWTVSCTNGTDNDSLIVNITTLYQNIDINLKYVNLVLNNNNWRTISAVAQEGTGNIYWDIGDMKAITLDGTIGTLSLNNYITYIFILDFNHPINKTITDNNIIFGGFKTELGVDICLCDSQYNVNYAGSAKYFNINHWGSTTTSPQNTNYGGWAACDLRYDILGAVNIAPSGYGRQKTTSAVGYNATLIAINSPIANTLISALPSDMRNVLKLWTRWIDNRGNKSNADTNIMACIDAGISLLTEYEIFGERTHANLYELNHQKQMQYYSAGNSKIKYLHNAISSYAGWWSSSAYYNNITTFCFINTSGNTSSVNTYRILGLAPAFCVGNTLPYTVIEFTIGTTKYYAQEDMTWQEWVNSEYNTSSWQVLSNSYVTTGALNIQYNNTDVKPNEIIVANRVYTTRSTGGAAIL